MVVGTSCELRLKLLLPDSETQANLAYHLEPESRWLWGQERPQPCRGGDICLSPPGLSQKLFSDVVDICGLSALVAEK